MDLLVKAVSKKILALMLMAVMVFSVTSCGKDTAEAGTKDETVFCEGVSVGGVDISGLTMDEGIKKLTEEISTDKSIDIVYETEKWTIEFADIMAAPDYSAALNKAAEIENLDGTEEERAAELENIKENPVDIDITYTCDTALLTEKITEITDSYNAERGDDKIGFDIEKTVETVVKRLSQGILDPVELSLTEEEIEEQEKVLIGSFSTSYSNDDKNRNENLRVACEKINGTVLEPGDIFDMNEALGPQTYENGYKAAGVIENGKIVSALGGGVCQVTTTIYNAAIYAELNIVERHNHSLMVGYVPLGRDAAVAGTYKNLRFQNDTDYPVYIETYLENNKVVCNIYGHEIHDPDHRVDFESVWVSTIGKPAAKVTEDPNMYEDESVVTYNGKTGAKVDTYKLVYKGDELVSREWFSSSTYIATADEITVGTKVREAEDLPVIGEPAVTPEQPTTPGTTTPGTTTPGATAPGTTTGTTTPGTTTPGTTTPGTTTPDTTTPGTTTPGTTTPGTTTPGTTDSGTSGTGSNTNNNLPPANSDTNTGNNMGQNDFVIGG